MPSMAALMKGEVASAIFSVSLSTCRLQESSRAFFLMLLLPFHLSGEFVCCGNPIDENEIVIAQKNCRYIDFKSDHFQQK